MVRGIGNTGEFIPKYAYAIYLINKTHPDPQVYKDPLIFDLRHYSEDRKEDKKATILDPRVGHRATSMPRNEVREVADLNY